MHAPEYASTKACRQYRPGLGRFIDLERISNRKNYSRWHEISAKRQHRKSLNVTMEGRSRKGYPISRVSGRWGGGRAKRARLQDEWALTFWVFLHSFYLIVLRGSSYHGICELQVKILVMKRNAYAYYLSHIWFGIFPSSNKYGTHRWLPIRWTGHLPLCPLHHGHYELPFHQVTCWLVLMLHSEFFVARLSWCDIQTVSCFLTLTCHITGMTSWKRKFSALAPREGHIKN